MPKLFVPPDAQQAFSFFEPEPQTASPTPPAASIPEIAAPEIATHEIPDADARRQALDPRRSWLVEAPAGSGKTGLLIQRFLKLLALENVDHPSQVLAITFTRKATSEMRERVWQQLDDARRGKEPAKSFDRETRPLALAVLAKDTQLAWNLLENPRRLNIRTIDALSADIAHALPVLSGSNGGQSPVEDASPLFAEAARRTLMLLGGDDPDLTLALEILLLHRDGNLQNCETLIADMLAWRDQWGELIPLAKGELNDVYLESTILPKLERALDQVICRSLTQLGQIMPLDVQHELADLARRMSTASPTNAAENPIALCRELTTAPGQAAQDLDHWRALAYLVLAPSTREWRANRGITGHNLKFEIAPAQKQELVDLIEHVRNFPILRETLLQLSTLPPVRYPREQWVVAKALFRVLSRALVELQLVFAARNQCDFTELALLARGALNRDSEDPIEDLGLASGLHLEHLLVDEMQDTSSGQYQLIELLTRRWDGHSQTVFLVGDPKQSIYLFRQARVERFVRTMLHQTLGDLPLTALQLTANFRSQQTLVDNFNQDFTRIFPAQPDPQHPELVPYREASAVRQPQDTASRQWHLATLPYSSDTAICNENRRIQSRINAAKVRDIVEQWRARPLPEGRTEPWKLAVLVRTRIDLLDIVHTLKQARIPYRAVNIEPLAERQEILDLLALTRALLHPADRTAWFALLRSPWCGLTLADLHQLAGQDGATFAKRTIPSLIEERGDLLSPDGVARLQSLWTVLSAALAQRGSMPLAQWIDRTWRAFETERYTEPEALANVTRFLSLLDQLEQPGQTLDLRQLDQQLARLYAAPSIHPDAVDLMTIHLSKGLEWDVVFVPALERPGRKSNGRLLSWLEIDPETDTPDETIARGILAPIKGKGDASKQLNAWMHLVDLGREAAERKRLFYVACTRAREELHLFASPERNKNGEHTIPKDSLLHAAWAAAEPVFARGDFAHPELAPPENLIQMPQPEPQIQPGILETIAAGHANTIARIPLSRNPLPTPIPAPSRPRFERPEGSFTARAFGNAMHDFLELLAKRVAAGSTPEALLAELPSWQPRITTILRANNAADLTRSSASLLKGLTQTLADPTGRWLLEPHPNAASELAHGTLRLDRTFLAGAEPLTHGETHRWIIDFKTGNHGPKDLDLYLEQERLRYAPQLETYAKALNEKDQPIRLALYYPLLARLIWWPT